MWCLWEPRKLFFTTMQGRPGAAVHCSSSLAGFMTVINTVARSIKGVNGFYRQLLPSHSALHIGIFFLQCLIIQEISKHFNLLILSDQSVIYKNVANFFISEIKCVLSKVFYGKNVIWVAMQFGIGLRKMGTDNPLWLATADTIWAKRTIDRRNVLLGSVLAWAICNGDG
jgi:hypothetical protein